MSISTKRILRELRREYPEAVQDFTGGGHIRLRFPDGAQVTCSASPSCPHFMNHVRQNVRRARRGATPPGPSQQPTPMENR